MDITTMQEFNLVRGPQDGAKVKKKVHPMPQTIFVGKSCLGETYTAWRTEASDRFPVRYILDGYRFLHRPESVKP